MVDTPSDSDQPLGLLARVIGVVTSPTATFKNVVKFPNPVGALFIACLLTAIGSALPAMTPQGRQTILQMQRAQMEGSGRTVTAEQEAMLTRMSSAAPAIGAVSAFVMLPVMTLIISGLFWALFNIVLGGTEAFKRVLAVVSHSNVVGALGIAVGAPIQMMQTTWAAGGPFNLGVLAPGLPASSPVAMFLGLLSVFSLWQAVVLGLGLAVLYRKRAMGPVLTSLTVTILFTAFWATMQSLLPRG